MNAGELELFPTRELIDELMRRASFQGVIVHAVEDARNPRWDGERIFAVRHNASLHVEEAGRLLDVVSQYIAARDF